MNFNEAVDKLRSISLLAEIRETPHAKGIVGGTGIYPSPLPFTVYAEQFDIYPTENIWKCEIVDRMRRITETFATFDQAVDRVYKWHIRPDRDFNYENSMPLEEAVSLIQKFGFTVEVSKRSDGGDIIAAHNNEAGYYRNSHHHSVLIVVSGMLYAVIYHNEDFVMPYSDTIQVYETARESVEAVIQHYTEHPIAFGTEN
jgi:hypothetical protein